MNHITVLLSSKINFVSATLVLLLSSSSMSFSQVICPDADVEVATQSFSYSPAALTVDAGTTVGWVNFGGTHDVNGISNSITGDSFNNPESFSLATITGDTEGVCMGTITFTVPGVYNYDCSIGSHAENGMVATLTIVALVPGCTDSMACNYDQTATEDDSSCLFVGDACDDGDANTDSDVIQDDCSCAGTSVSIVDELEALSVLIYPNPASDYLTIDLGDLTGLNTTMKMYDSSGKLVFEKQSSSLTTIDVTGFAKGIYTLDLSTSDNVSRSQVVVE